MDFVCKHGIPQSTPSTWCQRKTNWEGFSMRNEGTRRAKDWLPSFRIKLTLPSKKQSTLYYSLKLSKGSNVQQIPLQRVSLYGPPQTAYLTIHCYTADCMWACLTTSLFCFKTNLHSKFLIWALLFGRFTSPPSTPLLWACYARLLYCCQICVPTQNSIGLLCHQYTRR